MPKFLIVGPMVESENISLEDQREYWLGVGMKNSRTEIANMIRELSKANKTANPAAFKELLCVIKHVLYTNNIDLKIEPSGNANEPWETICFSDGNYAGDPVSRRWISRFTLYVLCVPSLGNQSCRRVCHLPAQRQSM